MGDHAKPPRFPLPPSEAAIHAEAFAPEDQFFEYFSHKRLGGTSERVAE